MKMKKTYIILILVMIVFSGFFYEYNVKKSYDYSKEPFGNILVYQVYRQFNFNGKFVNYSEFLQYSFSKPVGGTFKIIVQEPEQYYIVVINLSNYVILSVNYPNSSVNLNANQDQLENIYIPFLKNMSLGSKLKILSYNFTVVGYTYLDSPVYGKTKTIVLQAFEKGYIGTSSYNLTITYFYSLNGILLKSSYLWKSEGVNGNYARNVTSILYSYK